MHTHNQTYMYAYTFNPHTHHFIKQSPGTKPQPSQDQLDHAHFIHAYVHTQIHKITQSTLHKYTRACAHTHARARHTRIQAYAHTSIHTNHLILKLIRVGTSFILLNFLKNSIARNRHDTLILAVPNHGV
jgi:hypothetical protein